MKRTWAAYLLVLLLLAAPAAVQAQFTYTTNNSAITLAKYTGTGGAVVISNFVTIIGNQAFVACHSLTSVTIPGSVTSIGQEAFLECNSLTNASMANGVTSIGGQAFDDCTNLTSVTIPGSATSIGAEAFSGCSSLTSAYFLGNARTSYTGAFLGDNDNVLTTYYLPGTTGWSLTFWGYPSSGPPAVLWNPLIQAGGANFGVLNNEFGFNITGNHQHPHRGGSLHQSGLPRLDSANERQSHQRFVLFQRTVADEQFRPLLPHQLALTWWKVRINPESFRG